MESIPVVSNAQDRPNVKQNKDKPKISATNQGIKVNKLVKTTDPADEFSGVTAETYDKKPKKDSKKDTRKTDVGAVDEADDVRKKSPTPEPFGL